MESHNISEVCGNNLINTDLCRQWLLLKWQFSVMWYWVCYWETSNIFNKAGTIIGAIRPRITHNKSKKKKDKPWFDRDCSALKRSIHDLASRISNRQTNNELLKRYYNEKKRYKTLIRKKTHRQYKAKILNNLVDMEKTNPKEFWKLIDKFKNEGGTPSEKSGNISPEDWSNYFNRLLKSNKVDCTLDDSEFLHFGCTNITDY